MPAVLAHGQRVGMLAGAGDCSLHAMYVAIDTITTHLTVVRDCDVTDRPS